MFVWGTLAENAIFTLFWAHSCEEELISGLRSFRDL